MTTIRVRIDKIFINELKKTYSNKINQEHGINPTESQLVMIGLIYLQCMTHNQEASIQFQKNGKIYWKFK